MSREYKLRLGDGTVLAVDEQGLRTWAIDAKAAVQSGGGGWRPLKEVLAEVAASAPSSGNRGRRDDGIPTIPFKPQAREPERLSNLPALRLAAQADEEEEPEEVYEGDSVVSVAWLWIKRVVLVGGLVAGGVVAANTWQTWLPVVTQIGLAIVTRVDAYAHPERVRKPGAPDEKDQQAREALEKASGQLPHLSPETIQLVMSKSMWTELDPPELFSRAYTAAKRGESSLAAPDAEELKGLETALLAVLRPADRQRAREYDRARAERGTLPSEDREMLGIYARGARALPASSRGRLQALFAKAVAKGLGPAGG
jgi:hypothetical protein